EMVVVDPEAARQPELPLQRKSRNERRSPVSGGGEPLGHGWNRWLNRDPIVVHAVRERGSAAENGCMRRERQRGGRDDVGEPDAASSQIVEHGGSRSRVTIHAEM